MRERWVGRVQITNVDIETRLRIKNACWQPNIFGKIWKWMKSIESRGQDLIVMIDEKTQKFLFSFLGEIHLLLLGLGEG
jgi:hypothetical protein